MISALERLKAVALRADAPLSPFERDVLAETGLPTTYVAPADPVLAHLQANLEGLVTTGDRGALAAAFDGHFAARTCCPNGYRTYRVVHELLLAPNACAVVPAGSSPSGNNLNVFADWWNRDRADPAAAGIYARALIAADLERYARGDLDLNETTRRDRLRETYGLARWVLACAVSRGRHHWIWRQADFAVTAVGWSCGVVKKMRLARAFEAVQALDPYEFGIYDDRVRQMLRGDNRDPAAMDRFAYATANLTAARFGDLMYARIYDAVLDHEDREATLVDPQRLLAAFAGWYARFPSQPLANRYAAHAHAFGDGATVEWLFREALSEIHPAHWFRWEQPLDAWRTISYGSRFAAGE